MQFVQNVPFFSIMLCMACGIASAMLPGRITKWITVALGAVVAAMNLWLCFFMAEYGDSYVYLMGHFPAPWGNEIRAGMLEAVLAVCFSLILCFSALGGMRKMEDQVHHSKQNLYCVMLNLILAAMISMIYTNDLFTGYVFIEIMTLGACALIMSRQNGRTLVSAIRYMIMSLLGSGLTLLAITLTYNLTGHLLMENIQDTLTAMHYSGQYTMPITVIIGLFFAGLGIKSALYPFHTWLPDAYGYSTPTSSAVLSSIVSKAYVFLLIKIFYRVIGMQIVLQNRALQLAFLFGVIGMIMGSVNAIFAHDLRRMIAFSSVAQIGYIYAGLGLGVKAGYVAAIYHMVMHAFSKSALFMSASALSDVSGDSKRFSDLRGAGFRHPIAGVCFCIAAMSLVGVPVLGGFVSKLYLSDAAITSGGWRMWVMLTALAISTLLNVLYLMKTVITLYRPARAGFSAPANVVGHNRRLTVSLIAFIVMNVMVGLMANPLMQAIRSGLEMFD